MKIKWLSFLSKDNKQLQAYESWTVRWIAHKYSSRSYCAKEEQAEVFTSKEDAEIFVDSLKAARKLLKDLDLTYEIKKN